MVSVYGHVQKTLFVCLASEISVVCACVKDLELCVSVLRFLKFLYRASGFLEPCV